MGNEEELISLFLAIYFFLFLYGIAPPETSTLNSLGTRADFIIIMMIFEAIRLTARN